MPTLSRTPSDPFLQHIPRPYQVSLNVMGLPVQFASNQRRLLKLAQEAFEDLPSKVPNIEQAAPITVDLLGNTDCPADAFAKPPAYLQYATAALFSAIFSPADAVTCAYDTRHGLITVSPAMRQFPYNVRYEMIENATYHLVGHALDAVPLHGASLVYQDAGVLILGESGAGKSTLAVACLCAGWQLMGEDSTWVLPPMRGEGHLQLRGVPNFVHLLKDALRFFPGQRWRGQDIVRRSGHIKLELDVRTQFKQATCVDAPARALIFLQPHAQRARPFVRAVSPVQAARKLAATQPFGTQHGRWPLVQEGLLKLPAYALYPSGDVHQGVSVLAECITSLS